MTYTNKQLRTRRELFATMEKLLYEKRFEEITINDICDRALITRSTFYRYFKDKYDLTEGLIEYIGDRDLNKRRTSYIDFFNDLNNFVERNDQLIHNLNPFSQYRLNFYTDFLTIIRRVILSYYENNRDQKEDPVIRTVDNSADKEKLIQFIAGGIIALLNSDYANHQENIKFMISIVESLAK